MQEQSKKNRLKKMDLNLFNNFFDTDKRLIKEHEFRKAVFRGKLSQTQLFQQFLLFIFFKME